MMCVLLDAAATTVEYHLQFETCSRIKR